MSDEREKSPEDHNHEKDESTGTPSTADGTLPPPADTNPPPHNP